MTSRTLAPTAAAVVLCIVMMTGCSTGGDDAGSGSPGTKTGPVVLPNPEGAPTTAGPSTIPPVASTPKGTVWAAGPDPCSLMTDADVRKIVRFDVDSATLDGQAPGGAPAKVCLYKNHIASVQGGSVTVTVLPPGTNFDLDTANISDITPLPDLGVKAYVGHFKANPTGGQGLTSAIVDMGNGGFSVSAFVHADLAPDDIPSLARLIAKNWKTKP